MTGKTTVQIEAPKLIDVDKDINLDDDTSSTTARFPARLFSR